MSNLSSSALQQLRQEHKQAEQQVEKLQSAISVVEGLVGRKVREPRATVLDPAVSHQWPHAGEWHWRKKHGGQKLGKSRSRRLGKRTVRHL
jgi:hypothetical protein